MINHFPSDRVNSFSDGIFAVAITLLVLEVKVPATGDIAALGTMGALKGLIPNFIGLLVSFFVTALYWRAHLTITQFIRGYDNRLLWLNIWLLLFVVMLPFSTAFYSNNFSHNGPFIFYCLNLILIGLFNYLMVSYVVKKEGHSETLTPVVERWLKFRALVAPLVWTFSIAMTYLQPAVARIAFVSIFVILMVGERRFKRKLKIERAGISKS